LAGGVRKCHGDVNVHDLDFKRCVNGGARAESLLVRDRDCVGKALQVIEGGRDGVVLVIIGVVLGHNQCGRVGRRVVGINGEAANIIRNTLTPASDRATCGALPGAIISRVRALAFVRATRLRHSGVHRPEPLLHHRLDVNLVSHLANTAVVDELRHRKDILAAARHRRLRLGQVQHIDMDGLLHAAGHAEDQGQEEQRSELHGC